MVLHSLLRLRAYCLSRGRSHDMYCASIPLFHSVPTQDHKSIATNSQHCSLHSRPVITKVMNKIDYHRRPTREGGPQEMRKIVPNTLGPQSTSHVVWETPKCALALQMATKPEQRWEAPQALWKSCPWGGRGLEECVNPTLREKAQQCLFLLQQQVNFALLRLFTSYILTIITFLQDCCVVTINHALNNHNNKFSACNHPGHH